MLLPYLFLFLAAPPPPHLPTSDLTLHFALVGGKQHHATYEDNLAVLPDLHSQPVSGQLVVLLHSWLALLQIYPS